MDKNILDIYAVELISPLNHKEYEYFLSMVTEERKQRAERFRFRIDSERTMISEVLARYVTSIKTGIPYSKILFDKNNYGKPVIRDVKNCYFNISHSGCWIVCAFSNYPVGIDIEKKKKINYDIISFFSQEEIKQFEEIPTQEREKFFYDLWTLKESYVKAVGKGLLYPFNSFSILRGRNGYKLDAETDDSSVFNFEIINIHNDYCMSVCVQGIMAVPDISFLSTADLIKRS